MILVSSYLLQFASVIHLYCYECCAFRTGVIIFGFLPCSQLWFELKVNAYNALSILERFGLSLPNFWPNTITFLDLLKISLTRTHNHQTFLLSPMKSSPRPWLSNSLFLIILVPVTYELKLISPTPAHISSAEPPPLFSICGINSCIDQDNWIFVLQFPLQSLGDVLNPGTTRFGKIKIKFIIAFSAPEHPFDVCERELKIRTTNQTQSAKQERSLPSSVSLKVWIISPLRTVITNFYSTKCSKTSASNG